MSATATPARPRPVRWALAALLAACLLELVVSLATIVSATSSGDGVDASVIVGIVVSGLVPLALLAGIARGRSWALLAYAVLLALGLLITVTSLRVAVDAGAWRVAWRGTYLALGVAGVVLLLTPAGRGWFVSCRAAQRGDGDGR